MKKENREITHTLTESGKVQFIETYETDRYEPLIYNCQYMCEQTVDEIKNSCKIWTSQRGDYSSLTNVDLDPNEIFTGSTLEEDRQNYQDFLDKTYGKGEYEAFVLGAYIHSGTSFSVNKEGNHVCRFDSSQLGFIGLKKNVEDVYSAEHPDKVAEMLTAAWEGGFYEYQIYDHATDDIALDENNEYVSIVSCDYDEVQKWREKVEEKYHVSFDDIYPIY